MQKKYQSINKITILILMVFLVGISILNAQEEPLTIESAVQLALNRNERAQMANEQMLAAQARVAKARSFFFPSLNLTGTYTRRPFEVKREINDQTIVIQSLNALAGNISLNMILFDPATLPTYSQARLAMKAEKYNTIESRRQLSFEVATSFLMTLSYDQVYEAAQHRFEFAKKNLEASQAHYQAGLVSVNDVTRAELELVTAERGMIQMKGDMETAYLQLGYLLDTKIQGKLTVPQFLIEAADINPPAEEKLITESQNRRPDLKYLELQAKAAKAILAESTLKWFPSLSFNGQYRYTNEAGLSGRSTNWNIGLSLNWPLFDGFNRIADFKERRAAAHLAELEVKSAKRRSELEIKDALVMLSSQQAALKQAMVALKVANKNAEETAELYRQGLANALQVADANVRLFESEVAMVNARYNLALALLNLRAAQGFNPFGKEPK